MISRRSFRTLPNPRAPGAVSISAAANGQTEIDLQISVSAGRTDIKSYRFDAAPSPNGPWTTLSVQSLPILAHNGLKPGQTVYYRAQVAFYTGRISNFSGPANATTTSPIQTGFIYPAGWYLWNSSTHVLTNGLASNLALLGTPSSPGIVAANPAWKGLTCFSYIGEFDSGANAPNGAGVAALGQLLDAAAAVGRFIILGVGVQTFNNKNNPSDGHKPPLNGGGIFPPWWGTQGSGVNQLTTCTPAGTIGLQYCVNLGLNTAVNAMVASLQAYAQFDGHPGLGIVTPWGESIVGNNPLDLNPTAYWNNQLLYYALVRSGIFKDKLLRWPCNYAQSGNGPADAQLTQAFNALTAIPGIVYGGPDPELLPRTSLPVPPAIFDRAIHANEVFRGNSADGTLAGVHPDLRGKYPWMAEQQYLGIGQSFSVPWTQVRASAQLMNPGFFSVVQNTAFGDATNQFNSAIRPDVENTIQGAINRNLPSLGGPYILA